MFFLWLLRIVPLCTFVNKYLCQHLFLIVLGLYLWTELLARIIILCLIYWGIAELFFYSSYIILHSHKQYLRVSVSTTLPILVIFHFFFIMTILVVVKCILWFWYIFLMTSTIFLCTCWPVVYFFWKNIYLSPVPIFKLDCLTLCG